MPWTMWTVTLLCSGSLTHALRFTLWHSGVAVSLSPLWSSTSCVACGHPMVLPRCTDQAQHASLRRCTSLPPNPALGVSHYTRRPYANIRRLHSSVPYGGRNDDRLLRTATLRALT